MKHELCICGFFSISLIIISCNPKTQESSSIIDRPFPQIINLEESLKSDSQIKLSEIADSIKYILLSKHKDVIIGNVRSVQMNENSLFFKSDNLVMRFDLFGNFLNSFGKIGRGPQEYLSGSVFSTTPKFDKVIVLRSMMNDYLEFSPDGQFLYKNLIQYPRNMFDFTCVSDSSILMTFWFIGSLMNRDVLNSMPGVAVLYDFKGNQTQVIQSPLKNASFSEIELKSARLSNPTFTYFDQDVILSPEGDTIYQVTEDKISPRFILNWGSIPHEKTPEEIYLPSSDIPNIVRIYRPLFETDTKIFLRGKKSDKYFILEHDKTTGHSRSMTTELNDLGLINDLDGGTRFFPYWTNRRGNIWIFQQDAFTFKNTHSEEYLENSITLSVDNKQRLKKFASDLKQDDNPVITIVYLKEIIK